MLNLSGNWEVISEEEVETLRRISQANVSVRGMVQCIQFEKGRTVVVVDDPILGKTYFSKGETQHESVNGSRGDLHGAS